MTLEKNGHKLFPSPVGESYFSIGRVRESKRRVNKVSVPCRGILFFNECKEMKETKRYVVSVPCRGILFFNYTFYKFYFYTIRFRPLSGNLIFQ